MTFATADLYDDNAAGVQVMSCLFQSFGMKTHFCGPISTVKCHEDNTLVRAALEEDGEGRVLIVDGGGSIRCALVGDNLAKTGLKNGWQGIVVNGCIRDAAIIAGLDLGIKALGTNPKKSVKKGAGERDVVLKFADAILTPGDYVYADQDGVLLSDVKLR